MPRRVVFLFPFPLFLKRQLSFLFSINDKERLHFAVQILVAIPLTNSKAFHRLSSPWVYIVVRSIWIHSDFSFRLEGIKLCVAFSVFFSRYHLNIEFNFTQWRYSIVSRSTVELSSCFGFLKLRKWPPLHQTLFRAAWNVGALRHPSPTEYRGGILRFSSYWLARRWNF